MAKQTEFEHPPAGHVGILGYDLSDDHWHAIYVDDSGRLQIDIAVAEPLDVREYQYDGAAWRKSNLLWGYNARYYENLTHTTTAGTNAILTTATAAGYIYVVKYFSLYHTDSAARTGEVMATVNGALSCVTYPSTSFSPLLWYAAACDVALVENDQLRLGLLGMTAGVTVYFRVWGYKMKVNM